MILQWFRKYCRVGEQAKYHRCEKNKVLMELIQDETRGIKESWNKLELRKKLRKNKQASQLTL